MAIYDEIVFSTPPDINTSISLLRQICTKESASPPPQPNKPIVLYGAGNLGKLASEYLKKVNISFKYILDANADLAKKTAAWKDTTILTPPEAPTEDLEKSVLAVCISSLAWNKVVAPLREQGWKQIIPVYDLTPHYKDIHPLDNGWFWNDLSSQDEESHCLLLEKWHDDYSRAHHIQFLAWRRCREEWIFDGAPINTNNRYFIPEVTKTLSKNERFLDLGAHHGEVVIKFLEKLENRFDEVLALEPDPKNMQRLKESLSQHLEAPILEKIRLKQEAAGNKTIESLFISGLDYSSQIGPGNIKVKMDVVDNLDFNPSFIKAHLEGMELEALKGSLQKLKSNRPIIVVTAYHRKSDLKDTTTWLMNNLTNYIFLLRLHGWWGTGLVVYAVPEERLPIDPNTKDFKGAIDAK